MTKKSPRRRQPTEGESENVQEIVTLEQLKSQLDFRDLCRALNIDPDKRAARCPRPDHEDTNASAVVNADSVVCLKCGRHDALDLWGILNGSTNPIRDLAAERGVAVAPTLPRSVRDRARPKGEAPPPKVKKPPPKRVKLETTYTYADKDGAPVLIVQRWRCADGSKSFLQGRPDEDQPGRIKFGIQGLRAPLYRLPELISSSGPVYFCEGEQCVESLRAWGFTSTTSSGGARAKSLPDLSPLAGRTVYLLPDHDSPGADYAKRVARALVDVGARVYLAPPFPGSGPGEDVADYAERATVDEFRAFIDAVPEYADVPNDDVGDSDVPEVEIPGSHASVEDGKTVYREVRDCEFVDKMLAALPPGAIYRRAGAAGVVEGSKFVALAPERGPIYLSRYASLIRRVVRKDPEAGPKSAIRREPMHKGKLAAMVLAEAGHSPAIREIQRLTSYPTVGRDFREHAEGWNDDGTFRAGAMKLPSPPPDPRAFFADLFADYNFDSPADFEALLALLITVVMKPAIDGVVPFFMTTGSTAGTGKTRLLEEGVGLLIVGEQIYAEAIPEDEIEFSKTLTSHFILHSA